MAENFLPPPKIIQVLSNSSRTGKDYFLVYFCPYSTITLVNSFRLLTIGMVTKVIP